MPLVDGSSLGGSDASVEARTIVDGSDALSGSFMLSMGSETTGPLSYNINDSSMEQSLQDLSNVGKVSVQSRLKMSHKISGILASAEMDATAIKIHGDDIRKYLAHGDSFRVVNANTSDDIINNDGSINIGVATISERSPFLSNAHLLNPLHSGEIVRLRGKPYKVLRNGVEVQQLTMHKADSLETSFAFKIVVSIDNFNATTQCMPFNVSSEQMQVEINSLPIIGTEGVKITKAMNTIGVPGSPHTYKIYFQGVHLLGNWDDVQVRDCLPSSPVPFFSIRTIVDIQYPTR